MSFERTVMSRGHKYRQLVESKWDPVKKQSRIHVLKHLGKVVEEGGVERVVTAKLRVDSFEAARPVGDLALFWKLAEEFQVRKSLVDAGCDQESADAILALVMNQLLGRRPLDEVGQWLAASSFPSWSSIDARKLTKDILLGALDDLCTVTDDGKFSNCLSVQRNATSVWRGIVGQERSRAYCYQDVTRIRYNGTQCPLAERGYGAVATRPHVGFGLVTSRGTLFPLLGFPIRGSHPDGTTVGETLDALSTWELPPLTLVWDRGFASKDNLERAAKAGVQVLVGVPERSSEAKEALTKWHDDDIELHENTLRRQRTGGIYVKAWEGKFCGQPGRFAVVLDPLKRTRDRTQRDLLIQELQTTSSKSRIKELREALGRLVVATRGRRGWKLDGPREKKERQSDGRSLFFTTDTKLTGLEMVSMYYQRDEIEKAFRGLRGETSLSPIGYRKPGRVEAYLSVVNFLAYLLRAAATWKIRKHELGVSVDELVADLHAIHEVEITSGKQRLRRWTHATAEVRKLMKPFGIQKLET